jgi:hypothetical protein
MKSCIDVYLDLYRYASTPKLSSFQAFFTTWSISAEVQKFCAESSRKIACLSARPADFSLYCLIVQ